MGFDERVGVHRHEQVGLDLTGDFHAPCKRHEVVAIARHHRAHIRFPVDQCLEPLRDRERDVFLVGPATADGARVFAAVPGVDGYRDQAHHRWFRCPRTRRCRLYFGS